MRTLLLFCAFLTTSLLLAAPRVEDTSELTPETDALITPEALARYSEPGNPTRFRPLLLAMQRPAEEIGSPARNLRLPVRSWPDGRPQIMVQAEEAWITLDTNILRGRNVHVEQYREDGSLEAVLDADEILVDRTKMLGVAKGQVRSKMGSDTFCGNGALVDLENRYLRILKQACITTQRMGEVNLTDRGLF